MCIGTTRWVEPQAHRERVNVLGALRHDGTLLWATQQRPTVRDDVIAFFDGIAAQPHDVPRIVILNNAAIHKGDVMEDNRWESLLVCRPCKRNLKNIATVLPTLPHSSACSGRAPVSNPHIELK